MIFVSLQQTIVNDDLKRAMLNIDTQEALVAEFIVWTMDMDIYNKPYIQGKEDMHSAHLTNKQMIIKTHCTEVLLSGNIMEVI